MKTFIYTKKYQKGHNNVFIRIYKIIKNQPIYLGYTEFSSSSCMGDESEVFHKLIELKEIPKKLYSVSLCDWRSAGYYCPEIRDLGYNIVGLYI